jgi:AcrR family transcriptional regulator
MSSAAARRKEAGMSPRPYRLGKRQSGTQETRERIIAAARALLTDPGTTAFTVEAVAERADVARMTVYYQFKSKGKLLEALFDDLGRRANMRQLGVVFRKDDPLEGLAGLVDVFCRLFQSERVLLRRLNALAVLDPDVERAMSERGSWRREALTVLVGRFKLGKREREELIDVLHVLTSFETYDALALPQRDRQRIVALLQRTARDVAAARL